MKSKYRVARTILKSLKHGAGIYQACQGAGVTPVSFWRWRQENEKFGKFVVRVLDARTQLVEDSLYQHALKGNVPAMIFWLKNKAGWKDAPAITVNTGGQIHTPHAVIFSAVKDECQAQNRL